MAHDSTWFARTCAGRRMRLTASIGFLLACVLLAGLPAIASASTPEMRGEWELVINAPGLASGKGIAVISVEANGNGEFSTNKVVIGGVIHGTFSGTLEGAKATVELTSEAYGPLAAGKFTSKTMTVEPNGSSPSISGSGEFTSGTTPVPGATLTATRIKTYKEVEEREAQEAKEKLEQEEREARENIRGEWSLVIRVGAQSSKGTAIIKTAASSDNKFASNSALFEGLVPGSFSGTLEGGTATVTVTSEAYGPAPANEFTGEKIAFNSTGSSPSISGTGKFYSDKALITESATLVATRVKTYAEVAAREAKEKAEQEAAAKAEQEAKEKAEQEAKTKTEQEAKAKAEQEAKTKAEQEAQKKAVLGKAALASVQLVGKDFTLSAAGMLSLPVNNPNSYAISGRITLTAAEHAKTSTGAHGRVSRRPLSLGSVSFGISPDGKQVAKLKLTQAGRTELARRKTLKALVTILTKAGGQASTTKMLSVVLSAGKTSQSKH